MQMDRQFNSFRQGHDLLGRGPRPPHQNLPQLNYVMNNPPRHDKYLPHFDTALHAAQLYLSTLGGFDQHIKIYLILYHDFYIERCRFHEATAISSSAIHELAEKLSQHQPPDHAALRRAAVMVLCDNYARCEMPESTAALESLRGWAHYLNAHLNIKKLPETGQQEYQNTLATHAESTATALWQAYREFNRDPMKWGNEWAWQERQRVERQLEIAGNAGHRILVQELYPDLIEPAPPIRKLRPEACEFTPSDSGYASPSGSDEQQDPLAKQTALASEKSPKFVSPEDFSTEDLAAVDGSLYCATVNTAREETSEKQDSQHDISIASLNTPVVPRSENPSCQSSLDMKKCFNHTILLFSKSNEEIPVKAMFDTGCQGPNWVSREVVQKLGKERGIFALQDEPTFLAANGDQLRALGTVELAWVFPDPENKYGHVKWRHETFNILPSNHIQVIFGADYCRQNGYVQFNEHAITPLTANRRPSDALKRQMADEKRRNNEKKKAADEERIKAEKKHETASAARRGNQSGKKRK